MTMVVAIVVTTISAKRPYAKKTDILTLAIKKSVAPLTSMGKRATSAPRNINT
ncbi:hypothetical protein [Marinilactibacillus psychrotolerans]|uniref:hypothetical protein n=1 Tax=Marinilactibacillus psychrotolerans TaxID=191770 RepID=UPI001C7CF60C|nr:hypothetical protein [Marinilactibacillus psychrotolerans]